MLAVIYVLLFLLQLFLLVRCFRRRSGWGKLLAVNIVSTVLAFGAMWYFDTLPGYGMAPGWAFFTEVFYSLCAGAAYFFLTLISALCALLRQKPQ